jgi:hypothetical protein
MWQLVLVVTVFLATQVRQPIQWSCLRPFRDAEVGQCLASSWSQFNSNRPKGSKRGAEMGWTSRRCREIMVAWWPNRPDGPVSDSSPWSKMIHPERGVRRSGDWWVSPLGNTVVLDHSHMRTKIETILSLKPRTMQNLVLQRKFEFGLAFHKINLL